MKCVSANEMNQLSSLIEANQIKTQTDKQIEDSEALQPKDTGDSKKERIKESTKEGCHCIICFTDINLESYYTIPFGRIG